MITGARAFLVMPFALVLIGAWQMSLVLQPLPQPHQQQQPQQHAIPTFKVSNNEDLKTTHGRGLTAQTEEEEEDDAVIIILIGIFCNAHTYAQDAPLRDAYRSIAAPASVRRWFFFGQGGPSLEAENATHHDLLVGTFAENINDGKTLAWFRAAAAMQEKAQYVMKMDQDTVVDWHALSRLITRSAVLMTPPVYFGTRVLEWGLDPSVSPVPRVPPPSNACRDFSSSEGCWFYMSGGFYGVSMDVARAIARCPYAAYNYHGSEDAVTGAWMRMCFPSVRAVELPFGFVHYHYVLDKTDMVSKVRQQRIRPPLPQKQAAAVVSVYLDGGLGNQLFQAASSYGIATARGARWCIPYLEGSTLQRSVVFATAAPDTQCVPEGVQVADENGGFLAFQQWMMRGDQSVRVAHYLQSFRYFASSGLPFELRTAAFGRQWVAARGVTVGIHVRRTDQLTAAHGGRDPGVGYFALALSRLHLPPSKAEQVVVCTDDPAWVSSQPLFDGMTIRAGAPAEEDLAILAACRHIIMSIGTFGWWAAYLRSFDGETFYYAEPFVRRLDYREHFPSHWTPLTDADIISAAASSS